LLVIIILVILCCGLVPVAGAFWMRRSWRFFRRRFNEFCLQPILDYAACRNTPPEGASYRFIGGFESITDGQTLWIRNDTLTIPIALSGAHTYMLPMSEGAEPQGLFDPAKEAPERIRWDRISSLTEGAKVFVGGLLLPVEDRWTFVSTKEHPLLVIFYDGPDRTLAARAIRAGRHRNEYWNHFTPYGFILNAFFQIIIAVSFLSRPAFRLTVVTAVIAIFSPFLPLLPPGVLLTVLYQRLWWRARIFRAYRDLARQPLKYLFRKKPLSEGISAGSSGETISREGQLPDGEPYGFVRLKELPWYDPKPGEAGFPVPADAVRERLFPLIIPEQRPRKGESWYVFGVLDAHGATEENSPLPLRPEDPLAAYGAIPGDPEVLAKHYTLAAYTMEIAGGLLLLTGITLNILFITLIIYLLL
jgi:hypothetical protein